MTEEPFLSQTHRESCIDGLQHQVSLRQDLKVKDPQRAAVLVPICKIYKPVDPDDPLSQWGLLYTKRTANLSSHAREVCFPGGKCDLKETDEAAAVRESEEELGIDSKRIEIWTKMTEISNPKGNSIVTPVVGQILGDLSLRDLKVNESEVEDVFVKSFRELSHPSVTGYTQFRVPNSPGYSLPIYKCQPYPIWGMTAIITYQFLSVLLKGRGLKHKLLFQSPFFKLK